MENIDVVFVLGNGSKWNDNELRFALRSIEKNLKGYRKVWIIGRKPSWIKNVGFIEVDDTLVNNADGNIINKVLAACKAKSLTDDFVFFNDDYIVNKPVHVSEILNWHIGDIAWFDDEFFNQSIWRTRLKRTMKVLQKYGLPTMNYDAHVPMIINKKKFPEIISKFRYQDDLGFTMKSLYGNSLEPGVRLNEAAIFRRYTYEQIESRLSEALFYAYNDFGLGIYMKIFLFNHFPGPSQYEKANSTDRALDILSWFAFNGNIEDGLDLLNKYSQSGPVKRTFAMGLRNRSKLEQQLLNLV